MCRGGINGKRLVRGANGDFFGTVSAKAQLQNSRIGLRKTTAAGFAMGALGGCEPG